MQNICAGVKCSIYGKVHVCHCVSHRQTLVFERYFAFTSHQTDHMRVREALAVWFELDLT